MVFEKKVDRAAERHRLEKELKKHKTPEGEKEFELLKTCKQWLESERPLRELEMTPMSSSPT